MRVRRVGKTQAALAGELGITRQALSSHLRELRERGLLNSGRGFIDILEGATFALGEPPTQAFIFVRVEPKMRHSAYKEIMALDVLQAHRVTGDIDLVLVVDRQKLNPILKSLSNIRGMRDTSAHIVVSSLVEER